MATRQRWGCFWRLVVGLTVVTATVAATRTWSVSAQLGAAWVGFALALLTLAGVITRRVIARRVITRVIARRRKFAATGFPGTLIFPRYGDKKAVKSVPGKLKLQGGQ